MTWPWFHLQGSAEEHLKHRRYQIACMARYGRQAWDFFDDKLVSELQDAYDAIVELVKDENATMGAAEQ